MLKPFLVESINEKIYKQDPIRWIATFWLPGSGSTGQIQVDSKNWIKDYLYFKLALKIILSQGEVVIAFTMKKICCFVGLTVVYMFCPNPFTLEQMINTFRF